MPTPQRNPVSLDADTPVDHCVDSRADPRVGSRRNWAGPLVVGVGAALACVAVTFSDQAAALVPPCPLRAVTGVDCPFCGGTRAVQALLTGNPLQAADHNLLVVALIVPVVYGWARWAGAGVGRDLPRLRWPRWSAPVLAVLVVLFAVARNLPVAGLDWLASG